MTNAPLPLHRFETFAHGHSLLHRLDPRAKLVTALAFSLLMAVSDSPARLAVGLVAAGLLLAASRPALGPLLRRLMVVNVFIAWLWLFLPLSITSPPETWGLEIDRAGLTLVIAITLKANAIIWCLLALVATTQPVHLLHALHHLKVPSKLLHLYKFFYRYIHVLHLEYHRLRQAMTVRAFKPGSNLHTYRTYANLVGMLLVRSYDRAERVFMAMLCRGFSGTYWVMDHFHWHRRDSAFCLLSAGMLIGLGLVGRVWP